MSKPAPPEPTASPAVRNVQALARLLDSSIGVPGTRFRIGLDPLIGLVPGVGDLAGVLLSSSILLTAARMGVPAATLARMAANVGLEALVGTVPVVGDLFDAGWKANIRNVRLLEEHLVDARHSSRADRRWLIGVAAGLGAGLIALVAGAAWLTVQLLQALGFG